MLGVGAAQVGLVVKNPLGNRGDSGGPGLAPGLGRSPAWQPCSMENLMDSGAWRAAAHGVAESHMTEAT